MMEDGGRKGAERRRGREEAGGKKEVEEGGARGTVYKNSKFG
jgi:hypothetical protein